MPKCSFSGEDIKPGTGIMYVKKDGKILWFKNSKCEKNFLKLKRKPLKIRWTNEYRKEHKKDLKEVKKEAPAEKKAEVKEVKPAPEVKETEPVENKESANSEEKQDTEK